MEKKNSLKRNFFLPKIKILQFFFQRPTAKELLRHPYIKRAKRNNHLMDLIDRYRKWRVTHSNESDSDSESDSDPQNNR